jgi:Zn-finger nucleic acid-binding protein
MAMLCPICRTATLGPEHLEPELPVDQCSNCRGTWITAARFFGFASGVSGQTLAIASADPGPDSPEMKLCPACQKFMHYYSVGHGVAFGIDKCNTCGGVWLNVGEWAALKARGLHLKVHAISSDIWQAAVAREIRDRAEEDAMRKRLGAADYAELRRVAGWLEGHAHRTEIWAHLQRLVEGE